MELPNGAILWEWLRLIACAVERRWRLIAAGGMKETEAGSRRIGGRRIGKPEAGWAEGVARGDSDAVLPDSRRSELM
jgi:hypothetical protein